MKKLIIFSLLVIFALTGCTNGSDGTTKETLTTEAVSNIETNVYKNEEYGFKVTYPSIFSGSESSEEQQIFYDPDNTEAMTTIAIDPTEGMSMEEIIVAYGIIEDDLVEKTEDRLVLNGLSHASTEESMPYYCIVTKTDDIIIWVNILMNDTDVETYGSLYPALKVELL